MNNRSFAKFHGLGNDFVVFDLRHAKLTDSFSCHEIKAICDRRRGVGADGVITILSANRAKANARMRIFNSDGSEAEMCGNGIRCVARYLHQHDKQLAAKDLLQIETAAGLRECVVRTTEPSYAISVSMGAPLLSRPQIPMLGEGQFIEQPLTVDTERFVGTAVGMGNPHFIVFVEPNENPKALAEKYGPKLERSPSFPNRTNVEFAQVTPNGTIVVWVWERGCGITQACGTGACATAVAAVVTDRAAAQTAIQVKLPGGILNIEVAGDLANVTMTGPAEEVFGGELRLTQ